MFALSIVFCLLLIIIFGLLYDICTCISRIRIFIDIRRHQAARRRAYQRYVKEMEARNRDIHIDKPEWWI